MASLTWSSVVCVIAALVYDGAGVDDAVSVAYNSLLDNVKERSTGNPKTLTILPMGDSITYGCGDNCTSRCTAALPCNDCLINTTYTPCARCSSGYRKFLWDKLMSHGVEPTMVGPQSNGALGACPSSAYHAGYPGIRISGNVSVNHSIGLLQWANRWGRFASQAQAVLLHIGTNDILENKYTSGEAAADDMSSKLHSLIAEIYAFSPVAHVYVSSIISFAPTLPTAPAWNQQVAAYNARIPSIVKKFHQKGKRATFVNMDAATPHPCSDAGSCCPGGIHPTVIGYEAMADTWFQALQSEQWAEISVV